MEELVLFQPVHGKLNLRAFIWDGTKALSKTLPSASISICEPDSILGAGFC